MNKKFGTFILVFVLLTLYVASFGLSQGIKSVRPLQLQGRYISSDSKALFTFTGDSLYIDCADSGCGIYAMKLTYTKKDFSECYGDETIYDPETDKSYKERHHISFNRIGVRKVLVRWENEPSDTIIKRLD